jgi:hypothetical protein
MASEPECLLPVEERYLLPEEQREERDYPLKIKVTVM